MCSPRFRVGTVLRVQRPPGSIKNHYERHEDEKKTRHGPRTTRGKVKVTALLAWLNGRTRRKARESKRSKGES